MPVVLVIRAGKIITATDGAHSRKAVCASTVEARVLELQLKDDLVFAKAWMNDAEPSPPPSPP
jgi:hypothetical protein